MNLADHLDFENSLGRLRAIECALQALILTHPDPRAFGEALRSLARSSAARTERDGSQDFVEASDGFRDACEAFGRAAEVAILTGGTHAPLDDAVAAPSFVSSAVGSAAE
jgi:hypothetical protein